MFRRSRAARVKESALSASELALQLAQDKKFRKRLVSAVGHGAEAGRRTRRNFGVLGTLARLASDQALHSELQRARADLEHAYARAERPARHRWRKLALLVAVGSVASVPQLRARILRVIRDLIANGQRLIGTETGGSASLVNDGLRSADLDQLTKEELYARAQELEIPGRSDMSKDDLISALRARP
jgi:hypothetical protein